MKIKSQIINHFHKDDWHINILPGLNFGNQVYGKGVVINLSFLIWYWNISIWFKNKNKTQKQNPKTMQEQIINLQKELQTLSKVCMEASNMSDKEFQKQFPGVTSLMNQPIEDFPSIDILENIPQEALNHPAVQQILKSMKI